MMQQRDLYATHEEPMRDLQATLPERQRDPQATLEEQKYAIQPEHVQLQFED